MITPRKLKGVPETMLIPLWAKAAESRMTAPIIRDDAALAIVSEIDYDFSRFEKSWPTQVGVAIRTLILDEATRDYLGRHAEAVVINLGAGLDTRLERLGDGAPERWYDLDLPEAIELRRFFFPENGRRRFIAKSILDLSWLDEVEAEGRPVLLIAEGLLMYFSEAELRPLFAGLVERFPGAEMLVELLAPFLVRGTKYHDSVNEIESGVKFKWGPRNGRTVESWGQGIEYLCEWNYFDFHQKRWKWLGRLGRLPVIGPMLSNRIARIRFPARPAALAPTAGANGATRPS
ncbi:MAG: class I SAM-dependent methyltransferase [Pseudomonadota bacterium]